MKDKEYEKLKKKLNNFCIKWQAPLGLRWWNIKFVYERLPSNTEREGGYNCCAHTTAKWEYLTATITFNIPQLSIYSDSELEEIVVHEFCHVLIAETRQWADTMIPQGKLDEAAKHEERVVTCMTNAFLWTRQAGEVRFKKLNSKHPKPKKKH